jgi:hypothetical protein
MKGLVVITTIPALAAAGVTFATMGKLINSFPNHGRSAHLGMAADFNYLYSYHYDEATNYPINVLRKSDGRFVRSITLTFPYPGKRCVRGLGYEAGGFLRVNNYYDMYVARITTRGSFVSSWGWSGGATRYGLCINGDKTRPNTATRIYQNYLTGIWWQSTTNGSLISSFSSPYTAPALDLAWDYTHNLIWYANYSTYWVFGMTPGGSIKESWHLKTGVSAPYGIAYFGGRIYVSTSAGSPDEYIWVYDCTYSPNAAPASLGRVKALFR